MVGVYGSWDQASWIRCFSSSEFIRAVRGVEKTGLNPFCRLDSGDILPPSESEAATSRHRTCHLAVLIWTSELDNSFPLSYAPTKLLEDGALKAALCQPEVAVLRG